MRFPTEINERGQIDEQGQQKKEFFSKTGSEETKPFFLWRRDIQDNGRMPNDTKH
jgi:hypothetical protein